MTSALGWGGAQYREAVSRSVRFPAVDVRETMTAQCGRPLSLLASSMGRRLLLAEAVVEAAGLGLPRRPELSATALGAARGMPIMAVI